MVAWLPSSFLVDHGTSLGYALSGSGIQECLQRMMLSLSYLLFTWGFLFAPHFGHIWSLHSQRRRVLFLSSFYRWRNRGQEGLHYVLSICNWLQTQAVGLWTLYSDLLCCPASHGSLQPGKQHPDENNQCISSTLRHRLGCVTCCWTPQRPAG